jgi:hypothetical protein
LSRGLSPKNPLLIALDELPVDENGARRNPSFATLKGAEAFQKRKRAELERHRGGRFNFDDREMLSQARDLSIGES